MKKELEPLGFAASQIRMRELMNQTAFECKYFRVHECRLHEWEQIYHPLNVLGELQKMEQWLMANPTKARKKMWMKFVINWLNKAHAQVTSAAVAARCHVESVLYDEHGQRYRVTVERTREYF